MKVCTVVGARPQFVKAAAVSAKIAEKGGIEEAIIHTGQHYDAAMSKVFFDELNIPREKYNLGIGSGPHGAQTGRMLEKMEAVLEAERPCRVLVYGDTNSTLAGALAAAKLHIPVAHVEAGMRSFNRRMPEEINRVVADHICDINFCSSPAAVENLVKEGLGGTSFLVGDVMFDCALKFEHVAEKHYNPFKEYNVDKGLYILVTCHRAENTDERRNLKQIVDAVNMISEHFPVVFPVHPRTKKFLEQYRLAFNGSVNVIPPVSYFEMLLLEKHAKMILTDSGGVQKEAFFYRVPCITMRHETEWIETVELGWNIVAGPDRKKIMAAFANFATHTLTVPKEQPYGDGDAAGKIVERLRE